MGFLNSVDLSSSGMTAERLQMDVISNNLANVNTTHTASGEPYRRQAVVLAPGGVSFGDTLSLIESGANSQQIQQSVTGEDELSGVHVDSIQADQSAFKEEYDPGNPDADKRGYVKQPNVSVVTEMVDMMSASRAYEANVTAVDSAKSMAEHALDIGKA